MYGTMSGESNLIAVERPDGDRRVGTVTFQRPEVRNALSIDLCHAAANAIRELATDASVIMLRGSGGNFSSGGDIEEVTRLRAEGPAALGAIFEAVGGLMDTILAVEVPVVAAVEGYAVAGGFELLLVCDIVLLSETASLGDYHILVGPTPRWGGIAATAPDRGPRPLPGPPAHRRPDRPGDGGELGLAYRWAPADEFDDLVASVVGRIAAQDRTTLRTMKSLVDRGLEGSLEAGLRLERQAVLDPSSWRAFK